MDFKILWIDDEPSWVASVRGSIEDHLKERGFTPEIIHLEDGGQIDDYIFRADIDIMIVDYNLDEGEDSSGDKIIEYVRNKGSFLEIVFYSQDPSALLNKLSAHKEHVHCSARDDVDEKIRELIAFSKYKYGNLGYMRGSVIAEAIDIENLLEEIAVASFREQGDRFRTRVIDKLGTTYGLSQKYVYVQGLLKSTCSDLAARQDRTLDDNKRLGPAQARFLRPARDRPRIGAEIACMLFP